MGIDWRDVFREQKRRGSRTHGPTRGRLARGERGEAQIRAFEGAPFEFLRLQHKAIGEETKLRYGIKLNIYDAARSYKSTWNDDRSIREILKDRMFRSAWTRFRGGGVRGGEPTTTKEKLDAAEVLGWHENDEKTFERLRNISP